MAVRRNPKSDIRASEHPASLRIVGARHNNLKNIDVEIPLGAFVCVTGASGSGKSSLVNDILAEALLRDLMGGKGQPGEHDRIEGVDQLDKLIVIDQSPIGRTPRSNPGHVHQAVRRHPQPLHAAARVEAPRLQAGPVQLQRAGRPLRSVRRQRLEPAGDGFPGRRVGHVPGVPGPSLQSRNAAGDVPREEHRPGARDGRAGGARRTSRTSRRFTTS